ncbi:MAG: hypothetical protein ACP6IP_09880 [Candidatus Njordarchaeia archaeon]
MVLGRKGRGVNGEKKNSRKKKVLKALLIIAIVVPSYLVVDYFFFPLPSDFDNPPKFCTKDFTELYKIYEISKFRSFAGHDYSDSFEHNRSMKHYYAPKEEYGNANNKVKIFSPVNGRVKYIMDEEHRLSNGEIQGKQIGIIVDGHLDFTVIIFHVNLFSNITIGAKVSAGQILGYADTRESYSFDIAISRMIGLTRERLYSYFQVITDDVFKEYQKYGIESRSQMIKPKEEVDKLTPNWDERNDSDWVQLIEPANSTELFNVLGNLYLNYPATNTEFVNFTTYMTSRMLHSRGNVRASDPRRIHP